MRDEEELKIALAESRAKLVKLVGGFQPPPVRERQRVAPLIKHGAEVLRLLMEYRDARSWDWWKLEDLPSALSRKIQGGKVDASRDMLENLFRYTGIYDLHTRRVILEGLNAARIEREINLLHDKEMARGLREGEVAIKNAERAYARHLAKPRRTFYLAEFNLDLSRLGPSWPSVIVSFTSGIERGDAEATKSIYYRLSPLGSRAPGDFKPRWAGRGTVNVFTNSGRHNDQGLPRRNRFTVLERANEILMEVADDLGKTAVLPFSVGWRD